MTNNAIIKEYAKNKLLAEQAQNRCKELQPLLYDIMVIKILGLTGVFCWIKTRYVV